MNVCFVVAQGLLLPLASSGTCTIREAVILSSVINRCSLPVLHSAAALLRLAQMQYSGVTSYFIRILLDKKYALPLKVRLWRRLGVAVGTGQVPSRVHLSLRFLAQAADKLWSLPMHSCMVRSCSVM